MPHGSNKPTWRRCARERGRAPRLQRRGTVTLTGREIRRVLSLWTQRSCRRWSRRCSFSLSSAALGGRIHRIEGVRYVITGIWADTFDQHAFVASIVITPLALLGGVFYSSRSLGSPWSTLTRIDPLYYLVDATRAGLTGFHESSVWLSLLVAALVAAAAFAAAVALVARGWRLKP